MSGDAEIVTEVLEDALVVPETALRYRGEQVYVDARNGDGGFAPRDVTDRHRGREPRAGGRRPRRGRRGRAE